MDGECTICGASFSESPEEVCSFCEIVGLGICVDCANYANYSRYCPECIGNIRSEGIDSETLFVSNFGMDCEEDDFFDDFDDEENDYERL